MSCRTSFIYICIVLLFASCQLRVPESEPDKYVSPYVPIINQPPMVIPPGPIVPVPPDPAVNGVNVCEPVQELDTGDKLCVLPYFPTACMKYEGEFLTRSHAMFDGFAHSAVLGGVLSTRHRLTYDGLPKNTRQVREGYWIGSRPNWEQLNELYQRNVRLVISAATMTTSQFQELSRGIARLGMTHLNIPFGGHFPRPTRFMPLVSQFEPKQIFIHCEHGGDRSGAMLAFILVVRHGWTIARAILSVIIPTENNTRAFLKLLRQRKIEVDEDAVNDVVGIYSAESTNGFGGLKLRNDGSYVQLVHTTLDAILVTLRQSQNK